MNNNQFTKKIFITILSTWVILWLFFLVREDKDGQYRMIGELYRSSDAEKTGTVYGAGFYDFLVFCRNAMPADATYEIRGFDKYSIDEVRARYFLWPMRSDTRRPDFEIVYGRGQSVPAGYRKFKFYNKGERGCLYIRKGMQV